MNDYWKKLFKELDALRRDVERYANPNEHEEFLAEVASERWLDERRLREEEDGNGNEEEEQLGNNGERIKQHPEDDWRKDR